MVIVVREEKGKNVSCSFSPVGLHLIGERVSLSYSDDRNQWDAFARMPCLALIFAADEAYFEPECSPSTGVVYLTRANPLHVSSIGELDR